VFCHKAAFLSKRTPGQTHTASVRAFCLRRLTGQGRWRYNVPVTVKTSGIAILFGLLLGGLMALHIAAPWSFPNDDNGAWFSAVARTHLQAGLVATRGQDFFTSRQTGERIPYLHHPPLPGLILAAAFAITGSDTPATARLTFALLHLISFVVIALLARQLWKPGSGSLYPAWVVGVVATVPMSTFYGKMPNHEVPGLLFFLLGVLAWGFTGETTSGRRMALAWAAWFLAVFASWHATLCIVMWLLVQLDRKHLPRGTLSLAAIVLMTGLAGLHLLWANHWQGVPSQEQSLRHWMAWGGGASFAENLGFLQHAVGIGISRYAYLPAILAIAWPVILVADNVRTRQSLPVQERAVLGLGLGSVVYALLFPRAVNNHAYQGFYLIPYVALASSLVIGRFCGGAGAASRPLRGRLAFLLLILTCVAGVILSFHMVRKPSPGAVKAAAAIESQYR
jgi:hypothetical protein